MGKTYFTIFGVVAIIAAFSSCFHSGSKEYLSLKNRLDSLESNAYTPGFGEFMNTIEIHHAKLWFAGTDKNWPLAQYELDEMKETFDDLQKYVKGRPEVKEIPMIDPALKDLGQAIESKDVNRFKPAYITLTTTCNSCHLATEHGFNVITIPSAPPVTDQQFKRAK
ncbi:MAG: hypothetical protein H3C48_00465 [Chitinophagaceae bacterium]|nr:hypothetical protein [Chitinophagaceae bacterium]